MKYLNPKVLKLSLLMLLTTSTISAQPYLYFVGNAFGGGYTFGYLNLSDCSICVDFVIPPGSAPSLIDDVVPLPNGQVLIIGGSEINILEPPSSTPVSTFNISGFNGDGTILTPSGTVYYTTISFSGGVWESCLHEYDPTTNSSTNLGCADSLVLNELFFWNGTLYTFGYLGNPPTNYESGLFSVNIGNPLTVNPIQTTPNTPLCGGSTAAIPGVGIYTGTLDPSCTGSDLFTLDLPSYTTSFVCEVLPWGYPYGLSELPPSFPPPPATCSCETEAGGVISLDTVLCTNETLVITSTGSILEPDDAIEYILFTDLADTLGSIVAASNTPEFAFVPPLQTNVTYFAAAIAGNNLNGNVDLNDPCLDFSNALQVVWRPLPTVDFTVANPNVCTGQCITLNVSLTGTPPFDLAGELLAGANVVGTFNQAFPNNVGTLEVCAPAGVAAGSLSVQAVTLVDGYCTCL